MKRSKWIVFAVALGMMGLAGGALGAVKARQKLSAPALKLVEQPTLDDRGGVVNPISVGLPETVAGYISTNRTISDSELNYLPKDTTYGRRDYLRQDGSYMHLSVVLMGSDRTSIHKPEICLEGQGWTQSEPELVAIPIESPYHYDLPAMKLSLSRPVKYPDGRLQRGLFLYWFVAENRLTAHHKERFWHSMKELVTSGVTTRWAYVICFSVCPVGEEAAQYERMKEFIAGAVPEFQLVSAPTPSTTAPPRTASR